MESSIEAECRYRLRSLSIGSEVFTESDSILLQTSCHSIQEHDIDTGPRIGKGGFSDIIEVKNLKPRSESIESEATSQTCDTQDSASVCASVDNGYVTTDSLMLPSFNNQVYSDSKPRQHFVLKTLRKDLPDCKEACGRLDLAIEAQFLQTLSHPNIVSMHGFGEEPGDPCFFIIIERIDRTLGNEFGNWLMQKQRMESKLFRGFISKKQYKNFSQHSINKRLAVAYQLTSALKYLHSKNILFRDLKPDNIGLGFDDNIKVFDFGLAKELKKEDRLEEDQYHATEQTGTQRYMAPEVYLSQVYGLPADNYSFAVILWEMMSLKIPFGNMDAREHVRSAFEKKQRPKLRYHRWPEEVKRLIKYGWSHRPVNRKKVGIVYKSLAMFLESRGWTVNETKAEFLSDRMDLGNSSD